MPEVMSIEVDEEFDPSPPPAPFGFHKPDGSLNYGLIGGIAVAVVLVLLLIFVVIKPFSGDSTPKPVSTWAPKDPTIDLKYLDTYPANSAMVSSVQASLNAWSQFYTTGVLKDLSESFDLIGAQYALLSSQQPTIAANPEAGFPAVVELGPVGKVERKDNIFTVRVANKWTKPGADSSSSYKWDIDMKISGNQYLLVTVRDTQAGAEVPLDFCGAIDVVAGLEDAKTVTAELQKFSGADQVAKMGELYTVKAKAWKLLNTAVAGTDSAEDVQPILDQYQNLAEATKKTASLEELQKNNQTGGLEDERKAIGGRATQECEADIAGK